MCVFWRIPGNVNVFTRVSLQTDVCFLCERTQTIDVNASSVKLSEIWTLPNLRPPVQLYYKKVLLTHVTANTNVNGKSKSYASKQTVIGESALALKHLDLSFNRGGFEGLRVLLSELNSRVQPRKMATDLAIGQWAFLHALQVTRTHDVHCHCKTYIALFSTHPTEISTWILNDCTKTNEKFYLRSTQCIQGRKWKKICQVGSNKHENFTWFTV